VRTWEPDPDRAEISKLDPADVITTEEAGRLLEHHLMLDGNARLNLPTFVFVRARSWADERCWFD
jgi:hypothetical protein